MQDRWNAFVPYPETPVKNAMEGPLAGLRLAIKDLFDVEGYPTAAGNPVLLATSGLKERTAPLVQQLLDGGAKFVGKTNTDELAYSLIGDNTHFGMPINPANPDRIPGGSSSGSAVAVAAGLADIGLGTDTSGSIRLPAASNGLFGWRPTHGLLDSVGLRPLAPSFDTPGIVTRDLDLLQIVMDLLGAPAVRRDTGGFIVAEDILACCSDEIAESFLEMLKSSGVNFTWIASVSSIPISELGTCFATILQKEAWVANAHFFGRARHSIAPGITERLVNGSRLTEMEVEAALQIRTPFREEFDQLLQDDMLIMPTLPRIPPKRDASPDDLRDFRSRSIEFLCLSGLSGCPQLTAPIGDPGNPGSFSMLSARGNDSLLPAAIRQIADVADGHESITAVRQSGGQIT